MQRLHTFTIGIVASSLLASVLHVTLGGQPVPTVTCPATSTWFSSPSQPNFQQDPQGLCNFYQYAWQSFAYLMSPAQGGGAVFETYQAPQNFASNQAPTPKSARLFADPRTKRQRVFLPRFGKPRLGAAERKLAGVSPVFPPEDQQATSGGVLISQPNSIKSNNITYYEQLFDPTAAGFMNVCTLSLSDCIGQPATKTLRFPAGSIELKVAWLPTMKGDPLASAAYNIPGFPVQNNQGQTFTPDFLSMVGFHLVFATANHPELVWATFENIINAPDGPCVPGVTTPPPSPFTAWVYNDVKDTTCSNVNNWPANPPTQPPFPVTQAVRINAFGGGGATNVATIQAINQSVAGMLAQNSVLKNYFLVGAVWTNGKLPATSKNSFGSTSLANSTMETFTQDGDCFSCHNAPASVGSFLVSHAVGNVSTGTCGYTTTLPAACAATQK